MANTFLTPAIIAREALMLLRRNTVMLALVHLGHAQEFTGPMKVGKTITVRGPIDVEVKDFVQGTPATIQDVAESSVELTIEKHFDVTLGLSSDEMSFSLEDFSAQILAPVMQRFVERIDRFILEKMAVGVTSWASVTGFPDSIADLALVDQKLNEQLVPETDRFCVINSAGKAKLLSISEAVRVNESGRDEALRKAFIRDLMGFNWYMDQQCPTHTPGDWNNDTPLVDGNHAKGATSLVIKSGGVSQSINAGDIIRIGSSAVETVVTTTTATDGAEAATVKVSPLPAAVLDGDAITVHMSTAKQFAFHRNAVTAAILPPALPEGAAQAFVQSAGPIGMRVVRDYDSLNKKDIISFDVYAACKVQQPALACLIPNV